MPGIGVSGIRGENLSIDQLGGLQPAGLMVLNRNCQRLRDRCHSVDYDTTTCRPQWVLSPSA